MTKQHKYVNQLNERRAFFQRHFPLRIGRQRGDVKSEDVLKNSCPVCGYLTLNERDTFDICAICFWEDDGVDDFEENEESGPNHMTLNEGRRIFREAKEKLMSDNYPDNYLLNALKFQFLTIDRLITEPGSDTQEILKHQRALMNLLEKHNVCGLERLFDK